MGLGILGSVPSLLLGSPQTSPLVPLKNVQQEPTDSGNQAGAFIGPIGRRPAEVALVKSAMGEAGHGELTPEQQNAAIRASNAPTEAAIAELETQQRHLQKLFSHDLARGDGVLTQAELRWLSNKSTDPAQREAALWLLGRGDIYSTLPKKGTALGGDGAIAGFGGTGIDVDASANFVAGLAAQISAQKKMLKPLIEVPAPQSTQSAATGTNGGTPPQPSTASSDQTGTPKTPTEAEARIFANYNKVGAFTSDATSPEGRLQSAASHIQKGIDGLQEDLIAASTATPPNQAEIMAIQYKMQQVQNAFSAIMQMMKQLQEMQSNMSKMFSEMASSAIRNMR